MGPDTVEQWIISFNICIVIGLTFEAGFSPSPVCTLLQGSVWLRLALSWVPGTLLQQENVARHAGLSPDVYFSYVQLHSSFQAVSPECLLLEGQLISTGFLFFYIYILTVIFAYKLLLGYARLEFYNNLLDRVTTQHDFKAKLQEELTF